MKAASLAVVIPTRNRAAMAIAAVEHLRGQSADLHILVSDNSSQEEETARLADFCGALDDSRVTYVRSPGNLPQGSHWDWAMRHALATSACTHATIHYDRKIMRSRSVAELLDAATRYPHSVITYATDMVAGEPAPLRLWQPPWTGKLYRLKTERIVELSARGQALEIGQMLPILSNCIVPRAIVDSLVERFGTLCESTTADSCFAYRFCALYDDYLHLDRPLSVMYGSHRSAGVGYLTGGGGDFADYRQTWRGQSWLDAAPIPGLNLGYNMLFHEYELVRRALGGDRLPPLDRAGCLRDLGRGLAWIRDDAHRAELRALLERHGWDGEGEQTEPSFRLSWLRRIRWMISQRVALALADRLGKAPASLSGFQFASDDQALRYALAYPSRRTTSEAHLAVVEPEELEPHER